MLIRNFLNNFGQSFLRYFLRIWFWLNLRTHPKISQNQKRFCEKYFFLYYVNFIRKILSVEKVHWAHNKLKPSIDIKHHWHTKESEINCEAVKDSIEIIYIKPFVCFIKMTQTLNFQPHWTPRKPYSNLFVFLSQLGRNLFSFLI